MNVLLAWLTAHLEFIGRILHHWEKTREAPMKVGQISLTSGYPFIRQELCHSRQKLALPKKRRSKKKWTSSLNATQSSAEFTQCHAFSTAFQPVIYGTSIYLEMKAASTRLSIYFKTPKYLTAMLPTHSTSILWVVWLKFWRCLFQFSTKSSSPKKALLYPQQSRPAFSAHPIRASETWERSRLTPLSSPSIRSAAALWLKKSEINSPKSSDLSLPTNAFDRHTWKDVYPALKTWTP